MGVLQRFERRIEEMVNRPFARAFKAEVQPVEIAGALQRECDSRAAIVARDRTMVPNVFTVSLGEHDHERLRVYAEALGQELASMVRDHAAEQHYVFLGPVQVGFERDDSLPTGRFRVRSEALPAKGAIGSKSGPAAGTGGQPYLDVDGVPYALPLGTTRIGRSAEADLRIEDPGISRLHAEIRRGGRDGREVMVADLGSTNGVVIDGDLVGTHRLRDGDRILLGTTTVVFHQDAR